MGQYIVKLGEHYLVWSSIVDAPITNGLSLVQLKRWIRTRYGTEGLNELPSRLERVEAHGTSAHGDKSAIDTIWLNRAGPDESILTIVGIYRHYCLGEPAQDEWIVPHPLNEDGEPDDDYDLHGAVTMGWPPAKDGA